MVTAIVLMMNITNASPALQPQTDWSDQDPSKQEQPVDYYVEQTVTE